MELLDRLMDKIRIKKQDTKADLPGIPEVAARLIDDVVHPQQQLTPEVITKLARDFLRDPGIISVQDRNLVAYLFASFFSDKIPTEVGGTFTQIVRTAQATDPAMNKLLTSIRVLKQEVENYFQHQFYPYDYFLPAPLENLLAKDILTLETHRHASNLRRRFQAEKKTGLIVQPFVDSRDGSPGIWMSVKGIEFDQTKLK